jgi:hypothetical protein
MSEAAFTAASTTDVDSFFRIPNRVFLDTCVVNLLLDFWEVLVDGGEVPDGLPPHRRLDVEALRGIYETGTSGRKVSGTNSEVVPDIFVAFEFTGAAWRSGTDQTARG